MASVKALSKSLKTDVLGRYPDLGPSWCELWDPERFAAASLLENLFRKNRMEVDEDVTEKAALNTFLAVNNRCKAWSKRPLHEWEEELLGTFKKCWYDFHYPQGEPLILSLDSVLEDGDLGPGMNMRSRSTDFYTKMFDAPLTVTSSDLYDTYRRWTRRHPTWRDAEETRVANGNKPLVLCTANALSFVVKDDTTSRTICTEPTLNMFFQRGISARYEWRLRHFGIDLAAQPGLNRELARIGSVGGCFATTDLKSASDSFAKRMVREVTPASQLAYLELCRSPATSLPDGSRVELEMLSTMGNGYTFAFQTAFFTCVVLAAFEYSGAKRYHGSDDRREKNWGVFGDDIITPTGAVTRLTHRLLDILGFTVNSKKTFSEGPFRESCGGDYLLGTNVRPVFAKRWDTVASRYALFNSLNRWCGAHFELPSLKMALSRLIGKRPLLVPRHFPESSGIHVAYYHAVSILPKDSNGAIRLRFWEASPHGITVDGNVTYYGSPDKPTVVRVTNSAGLLLAFLKGSVRGTGSSGITDATYRRVGETLHRRSPPKRDGFIPNRAPEDDDEALGVRFTTRRTCVPVWDLGTATWEIGFLPRAWVSPPREKRG